MLVSLRDTSRDTIPLRCHDGDKSNVDFDSTFKDSEL